MKNNWKKRDRNIQGNLVQQVLLKLVKYLQTYEKAPPRLVPAPTKEVLWLMHDFQA
jgi:hypothetical protein